MMFYQSKLAHSGPRLAAKSSHSHLSTWLLHRTSKYRLSCPSKVVLQSTAGDSPVVNEYLDNIEYLKAINLRTP